MANVISCGMCMDLIPLVMDGVASEESKAAVKHHMETCDCCRSVFENGVPESSGEQALAKTLNRIKVISFVVAGILTIFGMFLCEMVMQGSSFVFVLVAGLIGWLLRSAFSIRKVGVLKRVASFVCAVLLISGVLYLGNEVFGNPVEKSRAEAFFDGYLEGEYGDTDYYIADVSYAMSSTTYEAEVRSESDPEFVFYVVYRDGKLIYDTYEEVISGLLE